MVQKPHSEANKDTHMNEQATETHTTTFGLHIVPVEVQSTEPEVLSPMLSILKQRASNTYLYSEG